MSVGVGAARNDTKTSTGHRKRRTGFRGPMNGRRGRTCSGGVDEWVTSHEMVMKKAGGSMKKKMGKVIKRVSPSELNWDESRDNFVRKHNGGGFKTA